MEKWTQAILKQEHNDGGWLDKAVKATRAKKRDLNKRIVVLPETMLIRINVILHKLFTNGKNCRGVLVGELGILNFGHVKPEKVLMVKPTTTVGEIKDSILEYLPMIEYNRIEIKCEEEELADDYTLQKIANEWQNFMEKKLLSLDVFCRNPQFMKMYKYFIDTGISREIAKNKTNRINTFFSIRRIIIPIGKSEAKAKRRAVSVLNNLERQNLSVEIKKEIIMAVIDFSKNDKGKLYENYIEYMNPFGSKPTYTFATNDLGNSSKEEAKSSQQLNNTVDTFQNDQAMVASMVKENTIKKNKIQEDKKIFQDTGVDTSMGNEKPEKQANNMGLSEDKARKEHDDLLDTLRREEICRQLETIEMLTTFRANLLELMSDSPTLPLVLHRKKALFSVGIILTFLICKKLLPKCSCISIPKV